MLAEAAMQLEDGHSYTNRFEETIYSEVTHGLHKIEYFFQFVDFKVEEGFSSLKLKEKNVRYNHVVFSLLLSKNTVTSL